MILIEKFPQEEWVEEGMVGHGSMHQYPSHPSKRLEKYKWENSFFVILQILLRTMNPLEVENTSSPEKE